MLEKDSKGKAYFHFDRNGKKENGYYIHINIQLDEIEKAWNYRCPDDSILFPPRSRNLERYELLIRYLASKGLTKDSAAVASLSSEDIDNIRNNIPNYRYKSWNYLRQRVYELVNEYDDFHSGRNINGNSVTMRYYFWKAAAHSVKDRPLLGAGSGDVQQSMNRSYQVSNSPLEKEWHKRPHNQFLTLAVALGVFGLAVFVFGLFYPLIRLRKKVNLLYYCFVVVYLSSFMTEDTIETQAGVTFFAFFNTFLLTEAFFKKPQNPEDSPQSR